MKPSEKLQQRFKAENFEIIDFLDEFLQWCQSTKPEVRARLLRDFEPVRGRFVRRQLPFALVAVVGIQVFIYFVMKQQLSFLGFGIHLGLTFVMVCLFRVVENIVIRRRFLANFKEILQTVFPRSNQVGITQQKRIRQVSRWFVPMRQFLSHIPGKEGLIIIVSSPTEPRLLFLREV